MNQVKAEKIVRYWLQKIGTGFHPDTRGYDYDPLLNGKMVRKYEEEMDSLFTFWGEVFYREIERLYNAAFPHLADHDREWV